MKNNTTWLIIAQHDFVAMVHLSFFLVDGLDPADEPDRTTSQQVVVGGTTESGQQIIQYSAHGNKSSVEAFHSHGDQRLNAHHRPSSESGTRKRCLVCCRLCLDPRYTPFSFFPPCVLHCHLLYWAQQLCGQVTGSLQSLLWAPPLFPSDSPFLF